MVKCIPLHKGRERVKLNQGFIFFLQAILKSRESKFCSFLRARNNEATRFTLLTSCSSALWVQVPTYHPWKALHISRLLFLQPLNAFCLLTFGAQLVFFPHIIFSVSYLVWASSVSAWIKLSRTVCLLRLSWNTPAKDFSQGTLSLLF